MDRANGPFKMDAIRRQVLMLRRHEQNAITVEKRRGFLLSVGPKSERSSAQNHNTNGPVHEQKLRNSIGKAFESLNSLKLIMTSNGQFKT